MVAGQTLVVHIGSVDIDDCADCAVGKHQDAVGQPRRLRNIMGDHQYGPLLLGLQVRQQVLHIQTGQRIERAERFIQQQQFRLSYDRACQRRPLRLPSGQFAGLCVGVVG